ncbi:conserved hypothetical protein [Meyerozyma guilliermondii ATCC 6260]|uniref:Uncharacterized protein n=1 Tax=Meyerozyma guilliermondii (strain ATCC 6260 / CBS 566 / DSM 6381 / JCM 1539 / NBRC 10279 / NRRL Y-324) TaxID=294746 RepID=A5DGM0_PICGU|nr:uncharacterized protein PGUG_02421 [Meyerozyma guilliermondii ATCC 6260]EDK38322.1 conserved hypothetical protein [Meyerozyma guilliermondii ATCC 6260]
MLGIIDLDKRHIDIILSQSRPNQVSTFQRYMVIFAPKNHDDFSFYFLASCERVVLLAFAQSMVVNVSSKKTNCSTHSFVKSSSKCQMASKTHSCSANLAIASFKVHKIVNCQLIVFIIRLQFFGNLVVVTLICSFSIVSQWLVQFKVMVNGRCYRYISLSCNILGKSGDGTSDLVNFTVHHNSWKLCIWVIGDFGVVYKEPHGGPVGRFDVVVGLFDKHVD